MEGKCHYCEENPAEFQCRDCEGLTCEDCLVPMSPTNLIDYCLCRECYDSQNDEKALLAMERDEMRAAEKSRREARNSLARERYWRPENVQARNAARIERKRAKAQREREMWERAAKVVGDMLRGL